jgi:hypothetical protein
MNFVTAAVKSGIMTPNEARQYLNMATIEGGDELQFDGSSNEPLKGTSPQDTGGGGGGQKRKMNIGTT